MSSSDIAISVRGISKAYTIAHNAVQHTTLAEAILNRLKKPLQKPNSETFWALKDVSFDIQKGDVVGVIGRNGAGKSTLLKILSRITEPTSGVIDLYGAVGSLLEVGTGFHPELTGRENIFLNGSILGMRRKQIEKQFDAIVDFAGVERFLDTPVKRYSSGMYVRLAFAVAAHLNPEILVVDEVLAVGDAEFQKKCLGKMQDVASSGRTVLFVSHNMAAIQNLCKSSILLKKGSVDYSGPSEEAINRYLAMASTVSMAENNELASVRASWAKPMMTSVRVTDAEGNSTSTFPIGADVFLEMTFQPHPEVDLSTPAMGIVINNHLEVPITTVNMRMTGDVPQVGPHPAGTIICKLRGLKLTPGRYTVDFWLGDAYLDHDMIKSGVNFDIESTDYYGTGTPPFGHLGPMVVDADWGINLDGQIQRNKHSDKRTVSV